MAKIKSAPLADRNKRFGVAGAFGALAAAFAGKAAAQAAEAPAGFDPLSALGDIKEVTQLADGTLEVVLANGKTIIVSAADFVVVGGEYFIAESTAAALLATSGGLGAGAIVGGVGVAGAVGAVAGGGGGGDDAPPVSPPPPAASPVFTSGTTATFAENGTGTVYTAAATDADSPALTYSITGGADASRFTINAATGVVTFVSSPNFEAPADAGADNVYDLQITASDGTNTAVRSVAVTVTNVNDEAPVFTSGTAVTFAENGTGTVYTAAATDADGPTVTYAITGGVDAPLFAINAATGAVTFISPPDFENPRNGDGSRDGEKIGEGGLRPSVPETPPNVYQLEITASDGTFTAVRSVSVTVTDVFEAPPVFTSGTTATFAEHGTGTVYTAVATDADSANLIYSINGGPDAARFAINSVTGAVTFVSSPDFEVPTDLGENNVYEFEVRASDGARFAYRTVSVTVTDINDTAPVLSVTALGPAEGFVIQGDQLYDQTGTSVSSAGDVNGDGFDDIIIGADLARSGANYAGRAYVVYGGPGGFGTDVAGRQVIDLSSLTPSEGFIIDGAISGRVGSSVSSAGDVNGDGFADILVGAPRALAPNGDATGQAFVVFGSDGPMGTVDGTGRAIVNLQTLTGSQGFVLQGDSDGASGFVFTGASLGSAGDVNGDGFDDFIIGAPFLDAGSLNEGRAYVIFGGNGTFGTALSGRQVIDLSNLDASQGFVIQGDVPSDLAGRAVSSAGDINGDGYDDLLIGAANGDGAPNGRGEAYVVFGGPGAFGTNVGATQLLDLATLTAAQGFIIAANPNAGSLTFGDTVSAIGDFNADGYDDLVVGASGNSGGGDRRGEAYVIFGGPGTFGTDVAGRQVIAFATLTPAQGLVINGARSSDYAGSSVSAAGDVNGDGFADLLIGAENADVGGIRTGAAYVVFGGLGAIGSLVDGRQVLNLATLAPGQGFVIQGDGAEDQFGESVSAAGDVNGDGFDDLIVGAYRGDDGGFQAGEGYVIFGGATGTESTVSVSRTGTASADNFTGDAGNDTFTGIGTNDVVRGGAGNDAISVSALGFADIEGGRGTDTLALSGSGLTLDLTGPGNAGVSSVEVIDLTGTGNNTVIFDQQAVFDLTEERSGGDATLTIRGNAGDTADLGGAGGGFNANGTVTEGGITYDIYTNGNANVRVQTGVITVAVPPPAQVIDLTSLSAAQGFVIQGDAANDAAGYSVSSAGDVNGDGFGDLIIGAPYGSDDGALSGEAYVVFGGAGGFGTDVSGRQVIDLTTLTSTEGFIIQGDAAFNLAGFSVSSAGDVNGDGIDDLIVGAPLGDDAGTNAGEAYVVFGGAGGFGTAVGSRQVIDLTNLSASQGFIIQGDATEDAAGQSVSSAGDINGDGFDDLIVGAPLGDDGGPNAGEAYVVFGGAGGFGTLGVDGRRVIALTSLTASQGFIIQGDEMVDIAGTSVASAGDVNGDGFDDLIVGAYGGDDADTDAGEAYVLFGGAGLFGAASGGRQVIDLTSLSVAQGFIIQGDAESDLAGNSVSSAGDINGDGFDDLIVGAHVGDDGGPNAGEAYVVFGGAGGFGTDVGGRTVIALSTLTAAQGFIIQGDYEYDRAGFSVASAGDINGDGFDDLIVGAYRGDDGGYAAGEAYIVFGGAGGFGTDVGGRQVIDLTNLNASQGFIIQGDEAQDHAGRSVSSAGDVNGDGFDDLIVGAPFGDDGGASAGEAYVLFGGATGTESTVAVSRAGTGSADNFTGNAGDDTFTGIGANDVVRGGAGNDAISVSALGFADIEGGRGTDTLALSGSGLTLDLTGPGNAGVSSVEVIDLTGTGNNTVILDQQAVFDLTEERSGGAATLTIRGNAGDTADLGGAGGGFLANGTVTDGGITYNVFSNGNANVRVQTGITTVAEPPPQVIDLTTISASQGFIVQGDGPGDLLGRSVANAGDVNGDGFDDLIIGADRGNDGGGMAGEAYVVFGAAGGFGTVVGSRRVIDTTSLSASQGFIIQGDTASDFAGRSVASAGDVNGDGFADLIVGAFGGDDGGIYAGEAYVVFGGAGTFGTSVNTGGFNRQVIDLTSLSASQGFIIQGDGAGDFSGLSVSSAGDVNGDGFDDLVVGAALGSDGGSVAGEAYVVFGGAGAFGITVGSRRVVDLTNLSASQGFIIQGDTSGDNAGRSVSSAGDVNGDGFDDLIVGAYGGDDGGSNAGEAYVVFGGSGTFGTATSGRQVIDLTSLSSSQGFIIQGDAANDSIGYSVSSAGDVNGDGFDELIVGARYGDDGGTNAGEAYIVFGGSGPLGTLDGANRRVIDLATLSASQGFIIQGDTAGDVLGFSVSAAGDVNGDGFGDLIVGAAKGDDGGNYAGEAYVVFGGPGTFGTDIAGRQVIDLTTLTTAQGFIVQGDTTYDSAGQSVSSAGDVNGDGFDDLIVGAVNGSDGGSGAGEGYVIFGGATGTESTVAVSRTGTGSADNFTGNAGNDTFTGIGANDVVRGGAGNDAISASAVSFADIDGGTGRDTLALSGAGMTLTLTGAGTARIQSIESIDLTGTGNNTLNLDQQAVFDLTEERSGGAATLTIRGNAGDVVNITEVFTAGGSVTDGGVTYNIFTRGNATLRVEQGVAFSSSAEVADSDPKGVLLAEPMGIASDGENVPVFGTAMLEVLDDQPLDLNSGFGGTAGGFDAGDVWTPAGFALEGLDIIDGGAVDLAIQREAQMAADLLLIDAALASQNG